MIAALLQYPFDISVAFFPKAVGMVDRPWRIWTSWPQRRCGRDPGIGQFCFDDEAFLRFGMLWTPKIPIQIVPGLCRFQYQRVGAFAEMRAHLPDWLHVEFRLPNEGRRA